MGLIYEIWRTFPTVAEVSNCGTFIQVTWNRLH